MAEKVRLDTYIYQEGYATSREKAKALIMSGVVYVDNQKSDKPGIMITEQSVVEVRGKGLKYVSRGGLKLEKAIGFFDIIIQNKICMDVGASTGGFTDCMLQNGASKVYSIDVGYGQLDWKLRTDERVVNFERTNVRYLSEDKVPDKIDFTSIDVSFISLTKVLPVVQRFLSERGEIVCLIKPQFEAGRENVGKKGVVRDPSVHIMVINKIIAFSKELGFKIAGLTFSPVKGPEGNIEYLLYLQKRDNLIEVTDIDVDKIVSDSHNELDKL